MTSTEPEWVPADPSVPAGGQPVHLDAVTKLLRSPARVAAARRAERLSRVSRSIDDLAARAAHLLGAAAAQISVLTDEQVIVAGAGTAAPTVGTSNPLEGALCTLTAAHGGPLVLPDAGRDSRSMALAPVSSGSVAGYLGVPLHDGVGQVVGSVCVFTPTVRSWTQHDVADLELVAVAATAALELAAADLARDTGEQEWSRAVGAGEVAGFTWELATGHVELDDSFRLLLGLRNGQKSLSRAGLLERVHSGDRDRVSRALDAAFSANGRFAAEFRVHVPGTADRWVLGRGRVLHDAHGSPIRFLGVLFETTDVHTEQSRTSRIVEVMPAGFLTLDRQWRFSYLNAAAERLLGPRDQLRGQTIWAAFPDTVGSEFEAAYRRAVDTGEPQTLEAYYPEPLNGWFEVLCWPTPDGLSLYYSDITDRKTAADSAARATARLRLIASTNRDLLAATDVPAAVAGLARALVPVLAQGVMVTLMQADGRPEDVGSWHVDARQRALLTHYTATRLRTMPLGSPIARVLAGAGEVASSTTEVSGLLPTGDTRDTLQQLDAAHALVLPIRGRDRVLGALSLFNGAGGPLDPDDLITARDIATRAGLALDADQITRTQAQLTEELQRSLLTSPPEPDHAHIVVRYVPATESARVGGDWYDAFMQPSGSTMLVIGDVVGHDVKAAAAMAQLHGMLRGIAVATDNGPAQLLTSLDQAMELLQVQPLATALTARFEQTPQEYNAGTTRLVWSNAGHLAPLVVHPDGRQELLHGPRSELLLGVDPSTARSEQTVTLKRGSTVLLYTDGLIERRDSDLDAGQQRMMDVLAKIIDRPLDELCDLLITRMVDGRPDDDIALVAARLYSQDQPRPPHAGPNKIPPPLRQISHGQRPSQAATFSGPGAAPPVGTVPRRVR